MGISIAYRGRLPDLTRVEDFEDRLLDLALEIGGLAQIWRSHADGQPERMIRGVILNVAPGQESTSLLLSPEGWLIGLTDIQDAELGRLTEPPWCITKTQFGPLEGHVALVEMLKALKREFLPDLEVSDEGGYWETGDIAALARTRAQLQAAIDGIVEGLQRHGLSREAAEDPAILLQRIERVAAQVQRILQRPAEHPPIEFPEDGDVSAATDPQAAEALWDDMFKHNRRQQERLQRALEERRGRGEDDDQAFENAIGDLGLEAPSEESWQPEESWDDHEDDAFAGDVPDDAAEAISRSAMSDPFAAQDERHPLLEAAMKILQRIDSIFKGADPQFGPALRTLFDGAGDAMGGLAQALAAYGDDEDGPDYYGLRISQFKRALRGAAFARGALFSLRPAVTAPDFDDLFRTLRRLEHDIFQQMSELRSEYRADGAE